MTTEQNITLIGLLIITSIVIISAIKLVVSTVNKFRNNG